MGRLQASFADELRRLHVAAGKPAYARLAKHSKVARSSLCDLLNGRFKRAPSWDVVRALVTACVAESVRDDHGRVPAEVAARGEVAWWLRRHGELVSGLEQERAGRTGGARGYAAEVNLVAGVPVRLLYLLQVERFTPRQLIGRDAELAEMAEFCTAPEVPSAYRWWRAEAWSGKSALMAWFVLHPPVGVRVVSFFVTARWASQNDRTAFIENLVQQLLTLLGRRMPPLVSEATRETHLLGLLAEAAEACRRRGERLVLVLDGVDEDRGVHEGPDAHSIAALLPSTPPAGMRIMLAGRPRPPVPADVPAHHPLREQSVVQVLAPSPQAQAVREEMERELKRLLHGTAADQDLLGLVAAAGGGLSAADLAELTGLSRWEVDDRLKTVIGRSFSRRGSHYRPEDGPDTYVLGHEELQVTALEMLGQSRLERYRERLHSWADRYRAGEWPADTPEYLLRGYFGLLHATGDVDRMISCAIDPARQGRMLDLSGGDAAALTEITTTQEVLLRAARPDLLALTRLVMHRDRLADRNCKVPVELPAVWAILGQVNRAEAIASSITDRGDLVLALASVAKVVADTDRTRAVEIIDKAEIVTHSIAEGYDHRRALDAVIDAAAAIGDLDRAEAKARSIGDTKRRASALTTLAERVAATGDLLRASELVAEAEAAARSITEAAEQDRAMYSVVRALAVAGDLEQAESLARSFPDPVDRAHALALLAEAVAAADGERADEYLAEVETIAGTITEPEQHEQAQASIVCALAAAGDLARAAITAHAIPRLIGRLWALHSVVRAATTAGDLDLAEKIACTMPACMSQPEIQLTSLMHVADEAAAAGDFDRSEALAESLGYPGLQLKTLARMARAAAARGDLARTSALVARLEAAARPTFVPGWHLGVLAAVAKAAGATGNLDGGEAIALSITDPYRQGYTLMSLAEAAAAVGDLDRALGLAEMIDGAEVRSKALNSLVRTTAAAGDLGCFEMVFAHAVTAAQSVPRENEQGNSLKTLVEAALAVGDFDRAESVTRLITDPQLQAHAVTSTAEAASGEVDRVRRMIDHTEKMVRSSKEIELQGWTLESLAEAAAAIGDIDRAENIAQSITNPDQEDPFFKDCDLRGSALASTAKGAAALGEVERAEAIARSLTSPRIRSWALKAVAQAVAANGGIDHAANIALSIEDLEVQGWALRSAADAAAAAGEFDRATEIAHLIRNPGPQNSSSTGHDQRGETLCSLAKAASAAGELDQAEIIIQSMGASNDRGLALSQLAEAAAAIGDLDRAERIALSKTTPEGQVFVLTAVVGAATAVVDHRRLADLLDRAEATSRDITHTYWQPEALARVAEAAAALGDLDRAENIALSIEDPKCQAKTLLAVAPEHDTHRRNRAVARALALTEWTSTLPQLLELAPQALATITAELDTLSDCDPRHTLATRRDDSRLSL
ncbi:hypothetical protein GCM10010174_89990 [Kutzneria viridogrisea]|uniref:Tetratricopeptide (TPR) repeat protein n=1 Tax=Kutzneria viridogrisea TaxID=47990 RepID=A0ABR6BDW7_9PSEU|nr:tetratricopeptide (TPR) repeat protein [Kutzneria viridogrisea]